MGFGFGDFLAHVSVIFDLPKISSNPLATISNIMDTLPTTCMLTENLWDMINLTIYSSTYYIL